MEIIATQDFGVKKYLADTKNGHVKTIHREEAKQFENKEEALKVKAMLLNKEDFFIETIMLKIIILPSNEPTNLGIRKNFSTPLTPVGKKAYLFSNIPDNNWDYLNIYFVYDHPTAGDFQINHLTNKISIRTNSYLEVSEANCSKIVASTDKYLGLLIEEFGQYEPPQIKDAFIQNYVINEKVYEREDSYKNIDLYEYIIDVINE